MLAGCRGTAWSEPPRVGGHGDVRSTEGARHYPPRPVAGAPGRDSSRQRCRSATSRTRPSTAAGGPRPSARSSARRRSSRRCATPSARTGSRHGLLFVGPRGTGKTSHGPDPGQGPQLPEPRATASRATRAPPASRSARAGRSTSIEIDAASNNTRRRHARAAAADLHRPVGPAPQGLHHRRGPAHHAGLGRAPQDARGAARPRRLHLLHDRRQPDPAGRPVARPALRLPAADRRPDRRQARARSWPPTGGPPSPRRST